MTPKTRGVYEADEERPPLTARVVSDKWTTMETLIFNTLTRHWDRTPGAPPFSERLRVAQVMLEAFDEETRRA